ncbi:HAD-IC family P-type ATPase [Gordonia sp. (in: high G+C Gram-positive bacteria)]|uniref:HAD-IC family P-type ATPase n=1 Tax=Gordonia sp. (in: high G+C Gram-positive bacteria) TaxID=84139 RepID=UPI0016B13489|nr:HAD-IC family P-type ATPase [Gordonia sp. (in: high G+C Gram-positive bacteria)]NLG46019.1 HAD-IC family P-type ATPase [Gordonia sp. (in: high G+C Gram-positive bacteria)]
MTISTTTGRDPGLTAAEVAERVAAGQANVTADKSGRSIADIVKANVFTRINAILGVLFVIVASTGSFINGLFGLLIIANSGIGIIQEVRAKRTLDRLAIVGQARPVVRRDGVAAEIASDEVVLGDIIELGPGDQVIVDGETIESESLDMDESLLTGEADAVDKALGDEIMSGSFVVSGSGAYRATKVGADSYANKLAAEASKFTLVSSELRSGIDQILKVITWLLIPAGILTIVNQLFISQNGLRTALLGMVAALVPMVPEGLVLMTSIAFAVGVVRLGQRQCLVNELPAIEGLARVDIVCTDKTGTLTENGMRLSEVRLVDEATGSGVTGSGGVSQQQVEEALASIAAHDPRPNASIQAIQEAFPDAPDWTTSSILPFSSANKFSGMSLQDATGAAKGNWLIGAPDVLLDPATETAQLASDLGSTGLRILLVATTDVPVDTAPTGDSNVPGTLVPTALVVLEQRVRPDARDTIKYFESQHVAVKIISGDNARSVGAVGQSLGLGDPDTAVDARDLPTGDDELAGVIAEADAFGRVRPDQKRAMVKALQAQEHTVAMTGDGVNDVLALKDADIGVAMGAGSSAARSVAQIVLLDNKFATLPYVVGEGRRVIGNIERVSNLFLTKTVYAVLLALLIGGAGLLAKIFGWEPVSYPFQPIHVTISAWFTIGIPAFVLSLAPNNERAKTGFVRRVLTQAVPNGIIVGLATFVCFLIVNRDYSAVLGGYVSGVATDPSTGLAAVANATQTLGAIQMQAATAALATMIAIAVYVLVVVARPYNWWKIVLLAVSVGAYVLIFTLPFTQRLFHLDSSNGQMMAVAGVCAAVGIVAVEISTQVLNRYLERRNKLREHRIALELESSDS